MPALNVVNYYKPLKLWHVLGLNCVAYPQLKLLGLSGAVESLSVFKAPHVNFNNLRKRFTVIRPYGFFDITPSIPILA